jgi:hypothetical protein
MALLKEALAACEGVERRLGFRMSVGYRVIDAFMQMERMDGEEMRDGVMELEEGKLEDYLHLEDIRLLATIRDVEVARIAR